MIFITRKCRPRNNYILSIGHLDYMTNVGGVEKVIGEHARILLSEGISCVFICPFDHFGGQYKLYIDQQYIGTYTIKGICGLIKSWQPKVHLLGIHIHHLMFWNREDVNYIFTRISTEYVFFLHDYYYICENCNLLKNDTEFCGAGRPDQHKCADCKYNKCIDERNHFFDKIFKACSANKVTFIAPSGYVKCLWVKCFPEYQDNTVVIEHLWFEGEIQLRHKFDKELRIAFLGSQYAIKGWPEYSEAVKLFHERDDLKFYHLGLPKIRTQWIKNIPVSFHTCKDSMIEVIKKEKIDVAIICPRWPETYNYTCYEAYMGGSYIITTVDSGNIADMVRKNHCGYVLEKGQSIQDLFSNGTIHDLVKAYRENEVVVPAVCYQNSDFLQYVNREERGNIFARSRGVIFQTRAGMRFDLKRMVKHILKWQC